MKPNIRIWQFSFFFFLTSGDRKPSRLLCFWIFSVLSFHFCGEISPVKEKLSLAGLEGVGWSYKW
jgi:hypothetical protein